MPPELPEGYMWSLPLLYLVTVIVVALLYMPCRWFAAFKERRRDPTLARPRLTPRRPSVPATFRTSETKLELTIPAD
jgi:hypothetical protein